MSASPEYYLGIMTGTSVDAIDVALLNFEQNAIHLVASHCEDLPHTVKQAIHALCTPSDNEIDRLGALDRQLAELYANAVNALLQNNNLSSQNIAAIGCHGQTIRHRTQSQNSRKFTLQIGDPNTLAALTSCKVVADFRRKDIALGGEGAPLAPAFHQALLQGQEQNGIFLNLGGIANLSVIESGNVIGFDVGPANTLMDAWCKRHTGQDYDENGKWAQSGELSESLLQSLLEHPYFARTPPKSCGREEFNLNWLESIDGLERIEPADVQATLCELSARAISDSLETYQHISRVYVCGGGIKNSFLMERLSSLKPELQWQSTAKLGIEPEWIEAATFAWLARQRILSLSGNIPSVTGASAATTLGALYLPD